VSFARSLRRWFDSHAVDDLPINKPGHYRIDWLRAVPFVLLHAAASLVLWVGVSPIAVFTAIALYVLRMFAITGFYHRYFSHRAFKTSRAMQLVFAVLGATAIQRGPLWWASHHRHHHRYSDKADDAHSPRHHGLLWSHTGWFLSRENFPTKFGLVKDLERYPELRFLDRFDVLVPVLFAALLYTVGEWLASTSPALDTSGAQLLVWGFVISTLAVYHATFCVNSLAHLVGTRRYATKDDSGNSWWLALLTFGEGWHNNHHHFPGSARQGFRWWEFDLTYYGLRLLAALGLIWDLKTVPPRIARHGVIVKNASAAPS
jgi:stearoyl-CoA desaturase (delta-9 desaturase)